MDHYDLSRSRQRIDMTTWLGSWAGSPILIRILNIDKNLTTARTVITE